MPIDPQSILGTTVNIDASQARSALESRIAEASSTADTLGEFPAFDSSPVEQDVLQSWVKSGRMADLRTEKGASAFDAQVAAAVANARSEWETSQRAWQQANVRDLVPLRMALDRPFAGWGSGGSGNGGGGMPPTGGGGGGSSSGAGDYGDDWMNWQLPEVNQYHPRSTGGQWYTESFDNTPIIEGQFRDPTSAEENWGKPFWNERFPGAAAFWRSGVERLRSDRDVQMGFGYAAMQLGQEAGQAYGRVNNGEYHTPEEQQEAINGLNPGMWGLAGTVAGAFFPAVGPFAGGLIGGGVGSLVQGVGNAGEERAQAERQAAERLSEVLGNAADSVDKFRGVIEATGAPVAQLGQGLQTLQSLAPGVGTDAVAGAGRMALASGEFFNENVNAVGHFLAADPALYQLRTRFAQTGSDIGRDAYMGVADYALAHGDVDTYNHARIAAADSDITSDQGFMSRARQATSDANDPILQAGHWVNTHAPWLGGIFPSLGADPIQTSANDRDRYRADYERRAEHMSADDTQEFLDFAGARLNLMRSRTGVDNGEAVMQRLMLTGAGPSQILAQIPGITSAAQTGIDADQTLIDRTRARIDALRGSRDPAAAQQIEGWNRDLEDDTADQNRLRLAGPSAVREGTQFRLSNEQAVYDAVQAGVKGAFQEALLAGRPLSSLGGLEGELIGNTRAFGQNLQREAATLPGLTAPERSSLRAAGIGLVTQAGTDQNEYDFQTTLQDVAFDDLAMTRANRAAQRTAITGGPQEVFQASEASLAPLQSSIARIQTALRGRLTAPQRLQLENELDQRQTDYALQHHADVERRDTGIVTLDEEGAAAADAGADLTRLQSGSRAGLLLTAQAVADATAGRRRLQAMSDDTADYDPVTRAGFARDAANVDLGIARRQVGAAAYTPNPELANRLINDRGYMTRLGSSLTQPGDLQAARGSYFQDIGDEITDLDAQEAAQARQMPGGVLPTYLRNIYDARRNDLQDERLDTGNALIGQFARQLPDISIGGTSFEERYFPSEADFAGEFEAVARRATGGVRQQLQLVGARNLGYTRQSTFNAYQNAFGPLATAGSDAALSQPGNQSAQVLASPARAEVTIVLDTRNLGSVIRQTTQIPVTPQTSGMERVMPGTGL